MGYYQGTPNVIRRSSSGAEQRFRKAWVGGPIPPFGSKKLMYTSRFSRIEESKQKKRLIIAIVGSFAILILLAVFGVKLIIGFSILVDTLRGSSATALPTQAILQPPILDPLPIATKSGSLTITGSGKSGLTAIVYVNNAEAKNTIVGRSGTFTVLLPGLKDGQNTISAKLTDNKGTFSDISNVNDDDKRYAAYIRAR
jgi:hypothetical protein